MKFSRSFISIALISALTACGGSSSDGPIVEPPPPPPVPVKTVIKGKAIKGTMANAIVTVYKYLDGQAVKLESTELETASIITEDDGSYTITILDYDGPIKVALSVDENTTMICDAPAGCGEVAHGESISLATVDPTLVLSAISSVSSDNAGSLNVNVSALTHLAAALIESNDSGVNTGSIQTQSSIIANAFNIMGSLTELEPTAIEDAASVASEDNTDELRYGLINAGIMAALFSGEQQASGVLSDRLADAVDDLVDHDGALLVNQDEADEGFELSLVEVLDGAGDAAVAAVAAIAADPALAGQDNSEILAELEQQETNLENQSEYEEANEGDDGRSDTEVEVPTAGDAIAKAKAMVEDVRLFGHLFEVGSDSNTAMANEGDKYIELIDSAGVMVEAEAASFLLLADVADALSTISMMNEAGTITEGTFPIGDFLTIDGAVGTITIDKETEDGGMLFTISANSATESVALNASVVFAEDGLSIMLNIDGSIESAGAMLSLTEGSFAKVNLDTAATRATLEDDSYEGEVTSGELSLEVVLEQKVTDTVIDPVAFTGLIKTKLVPVAVPTLYGHWEWNNSTNQDEIMYGQPEMETVILPEMLTLSGGFSSFEGNLIKATLTVNIQDLESYQAPGFEYIGKKVENLLNINVSDDLNTIVLTEADEVADDEQAVITYQFITGEGNDWTRATTVVTEDPELHRWGTGYELKRFIRSFDTDLAADGFIYTYAYIIGRDSNNYYAKSIRVTPVDGDNNGEIDSYHFERISAYNDSNIGLEYNTEGMRDDDGNINFSALVNDNGQILLADGQPQDWSNAYNLNTYASIDDFVNETGRMPVNPLTITNGAQYFAETFSSYVLTADNIGESEVILSEEQLASLVSGEVSELNPTSYLTKPLLKDVFTIAVSEDKNTVTLTLDHAFSSTRTFAGDGTGNYAAHATQTHADGTITADYQIAVSTDIGLDYAEIVINSMDYWGADSRAQQYKVTPEDTTGDNKADRFVLKRIFGSTFNDAGQLLNWDGSVVTYDSGYSQSEAETIEKLIQDNAFELPINPYEASNAMLYYKSLIEKQDNLNLDFYIDGIGKIEITLSTDDLTAITAGSTQSFDAINTQPDNEKSLENEDVFLDASAALSLEAILGDYQVSLMFSGNRTALNDGKFDLEMSYKLPDDANMRKFVAHMKTNETDSLSVNNSEGVLLILNEPDEDSESNVIGTIVVGPTAVKAAEIQDREGVMTIVYEDSSVETL